MSAGFEICRTRTACAVLASGLVISLTALTGGVAPAFAKPGDEPAVPTTTTVVAPAPEVAPTQQEQSAERSTAAEVPPSTAAVAPTPVTPTAAPEPVAPVPVETAPTVEAPPKSQTREPEPAPREAPTPPSTRVPVTTTTQTQAPQISAPTQAPPTQAPPTQAPQGLAPQGLAPRSQASRSEAPSPVTSAPSPAVASPTPPNGSIAPSPGLVAPTPSETTASSAAPTTPARESTASSEDSATLTSSATPAAERVIEEVAPQTLVAPDEDVLLAKSAKIVEEKPVAAPRKDVEDIANVLDVKSLDRDRFDQNGLRDDDRIRPAGDRNWDRNVRQWRPDWVEYDDYYRPVLSNPYRDPVRIVYLYQNAPRIVWIPPLARIVLEVAQFAAYSFTALVTNPINQVLDVAVGSFLGGGFIPGIGLPLPLPPPPLLNFANVPVQVRYPNADYEPFRVAKIVDVGDDAQYGERKVLLDGVTPAWGQWTQTPSGERSFEVHKTQQFPGLDDPRPGPLPGDYQLRLAADESDSGMNKRDVYLIAVAVACGALSLGAVVMSVLLGRRRRLP